MPTFNEVTDDELVAYCELVDIITLTNPKIINNSTWLSIVHAIKNEIYARANMQQLLRERAERDIMKPNQSNERRNHDTNYKHPELHRKIRISTE